VANLPNAKFKKIGPHKWDVEDDYFITEEMLEDVDIGRWKRDVQSNPDIYGRLVYRNWEKVVYLVYLGKTYDEMKVFWYTLGKRTMR
jgi:hypothetical protein